MILLLPPTGQKVIEIPKRIRPMSAKEKFERDIKNSKLEYAWTKERRKIRKLKVEQYDTAVVYDPHQTRSLTHIVHSHPSGYGLPSIGDLWNFIHPKSHNIMQRKMTIVATSPEGKVLGYFTIMMPKKIYEKKVALYKDKQPGFFDNFDREMRLFKRYEPFIRTIREQWPRELAPTTSRKLMLLSIMQKEGFKFHFLSMPGYRFDEKTGEYVETRKKK